MKEIWIPETIAVLFLALPLARPRLKALRPVDGLAWLPPLALAICAALFPAYGFRPECLPLLAYALAASIIGIPSLASGAASRSDMRGQSLWFTVPAFALLAAAALVMFAFSPATDGRLIAEGVRFHKIRDGSRGRDYVLRIYGPVGSDAFAESGRRPLIFVIPPEAGALASVDRVCAGLRDRGFTVIAYSRSGFDSPAIDEQGRKHAASPAVFRRAWRVFRSGTVLAAANEEGKALEAERRVDIEFLIPRLPALVNVRDAPIFLAGYGAGGGALAYLAENPAFAAELGEVKGIIAIESRLWSAFLPEPPPAPLMPEKANLFSRGWKRFRYWLDSRRARRVSGFGSLPRPALPVLYLVSGRAFSAGPAQSPYRAVFETLRSGGPAALAAIDSAGPLDYCDYPLTHPLYSFLLPARNKGAAASKNPVEDTASLIAHFAAALLEDDAGANTRSIERRPLSGSTHIERRGLPEF